VFFPIFIAWLFSHFPTTAHSHFILILIGSCSPNAIFIKLHLQKYSPGGKKQLLGCVGSFSPMTVRTNYWISIFIVRFLLDHFVSHRMVCFSIDVPSGTLLHSHGKWPIYRWFTYLKMLFSQGFFEAYVYLYVLVRIASHVFPQYSFRCAFTRFLLVFIIY